MADSVQDILLLMALLAASASFRIVHGRRFEIFEVVMHLFELVVDIPQIVFIRFEFVFSYLELPFSILNLLLEVPLLCLKFVQLFLVFLPPGPRRLQKFRLLLGFLEVTFKLKSPGVIWSQMVAARLPARLDGPEVLLGFFEVRIVRILLPSV